MKIFSHILMQILQKKEQISLRIFQMIHGMKIQTKYINIADLIYIEQLKTGEA